MLEMTRSEVEDALAQAEVDSMETEEALDALKRFYILGADDNVPYCRMTINELIEEYEDTFRMLIKII